MSDSATPWTVARQAPSMGFSRQEYWSGLPVPSPGDLPDPAIEPESPALASRFFTTEPPGKPITYEGTVSSLKKESTSDTCCNVDGKGQRVVPRIGGP